MKCGDGSKFVEGRRGTVEDSNEVGTKTQIEWGEGWGSGLLLEAAGVVVHDD
jgi:hypothetical protein